ncbi:hypothetical protein Acr_07g0000180 [Actinidia rufa]|uniref:Uncharacterized protein n=1 Tax=Actinidia rufa TaxID=165716 RepID=A0A7J0ETK8_9ERIC|nr:hypothetical protein Acr_07g0000180 [Actinidia rufa]
MVLTPDFYYNSLALSVGTTTLNTLCTCIAAYCLDRSRRSHRSGDQDSQNCHSADLDAQINAINTGVNALAIVDALIRQTEPPFTERVMKVRVSSKFKLPSQLGLCEGKTNPMNHLDSYKNLIMLQGSLSSISWAVVHQKDGEGLKDYVKHFNQAVLKVEDPINKVVVMAMMDGLRLDPLFYSLSKSVPTTLSALQSKAVKYIAAEELTKAKRMRRGKDDHKRKDSPRHNLITSPFDEIDPLSSDGFTSP